MLIQYSRLSPIFLTRYPNLFSHKSLLRSLCVLTILSNGLHALTSPLFIPAKKLLDQTTQLTKPLTQLSYTSSACTFPLLPTHSLVIQWGFSGSGEAHEVFTPLPGALCTIQTTTEEASKQFLGIDSLPLMIIGKFLHQELFTATTSLGLKTGLSHIKISPLYVFFIKIGLLLASAGQYDRAFIQQEAIRLITRLSLVEEIAQFKTVKIPQEFLGILDYHLPGYAELIAKLWNDCSAQYDTARILIERPETRLLVRFDFNNKERAQKCYALISEDPDLVMQADALNRIIQVIEETGCEVNNCREEAHEIQNKELIKKYAYSLQEPLVELKQISWEDVSDLEKAQLSLRIQNNTLPMIINSQDKDRGSLFFSPELLSDQGMIRACTHGCVTLFKEYAKTKTILLDAHQKKVHQFLACAQGRESSQRIQKGRELSLTREELLAQREQQLVSQITIIKEYQEALIEASKSTNPATSKLVESLKNLKQEAQTAYNDLLIDKELLVFKPAALDQEKLSMYQSQLFDLQSITPSDDEENKTIQECIQELNKHIAALNNTHDVKLLSIQDFFIYLEKITRALEQEITVLMNNAEQATSLASDTESTSIESLLEKIKHIKGAAKQADSQEYCKHLIAQQKEVKNQQAELRTYASYHLDYQKTGDLESLKNMHDMWPSIQQRLMLNTSVQIMQATPLHVLGLDELILDLTGIHSSHATAFAPLKEKSCETMTWIINHYGGALNQYQWSCQATAEKLLVCVKKALMPISLL